MAAVLVGWVSECSRLVTRCGASWPRSRGYINSMAVRYLRNKAGEMTLGVLRASPLPAPLI